MTLRSLMYAVAALASACGESGRSGGGLPPIDAVDTDMGATDMRPTWQLQDIQPVSPRANQTYGLDAFTEHNVVVTLVAGF